MSSMNYFIRNIWRVLYAATAKNLPSSRYSKLSRNARAWFARRICASAGPELNIDKGATFSSSVSIGNHSGIGAYCELHGEVHLGDWVMMAPECVFYTKNHTTIQTDVPMVMQGNEPEQAIFVGNDVWFGRRVMVMPGAAIGDGCIVAAGTVVTKSFPPYSILGGVPAKILGSRLEK